MIQDLINKEIVRERNHYEKIDTLDCLFVNPLDMITAVPYVKTLTAISLLRENNFGVQLIDPAPERKHISDIIRIIRDNDTEIVCISAVPSTLPFAYQLIKEIRKLSFETKVILEGYHVNADPSIVIDIDADYGLIGDIEYTLLELCQCILSNSLVSESLDGLVINKQGNLVVNKPAVIKDLNNLPIPAYELMQIGKYYSASTDKVIMYMFTSRGCPFECNFCANPTQRFYRYLNLENIIAQLKYLVNDLKVEWIEFMDLTFTTNRKKTIELCQEIIRQKILFQWGCETRADLVDEELLSYMKNAGCEKITFGVESGNEEVRFKTGKEISNAQFIKAFDMCRKFEIKTMANFILGHPNETEDQMRDSIKFVREIDPFNVLYIRMTPLPDIDIFKYGVEKGEISPNIWVQYMKGEIEHPIYYPTTILPEKMEKIFKQALLSYYLSFSTIKKYFFLFKNVRFMLKSIRVFAEYTFAGPKFK